MKKSLACLGFTLAAVGCSNEPEYLSTLPQQAVVMNSLLSQPVGAYATIARMQKKDGKTTPTGQLDLLVKKSELTLENSLDEHGQPGTSLCATFDHYVSKIDDDGKIAIPYAQVRDGAKWKHLVRTYQAIDNMNPETLLNLKKTITIEKDKPYGPYDLDVESKQLCRFLPKVP